MVRDQKQKKITDRTNESLIMPEVFYSTFHKEKKKKDKNLLKHVLKKKFTNHLKHHFGEPGEPKRNTLLKLMFK